MKFSVCTGPSAITVGAPAGKADEIPWLCKRDTKWHI